MPDPVSAVSSAVSIGGSLIQGSASKKAAKAMAKAVQAGIKNIEGTQEEMRGLFEPYLGGGESALGQQLASLGLSGRGSEQEYIQNISRSPMFQAIVKQGEEAMLQNASATGGLRGGNIQGALAQFRPSMLNQFLQQRYEQLGGLTRGGLAAAGSLGSGLATTSGNIADLMTQGGQAQAAGAIGQGNMFGDILGTIGGGVAGLFGGGGSVGGGLASGGTGRGGFADMGTIARGGGF